MCKKKRAEWACEYTPWVCRVFTIHKTLCKPLNFTQLDNIYMMRYKRGEGPFNFTKTHYKGKQ